MNIVKLEEPLLMRREDLLSRFRDGKFLIYRDTNEDVIAILGTIDYEPGFSEWTYKRVLHDDKDTVTNFGSDYQVLLIREVKRSSVSASEFSVMSREDFYCDAKKEIENSVSIVEKAYGLNDKEVFLIYYEDKISNGIIYFGYETDDACRLERSEYLSSFPDGTMVIPYPRFLSRKRFFVSRKNRETDTEREETEQSTAASTAASVPAGLPPICSKIRSWLEKTSFNDFSAEISRRVKGQEELEKILANVYGYLSCVGFGKPHNNNMLVAAPSGCGKTETFRALKEYFAGHIKDLPVYQMDMTSITEEGFKGKNTNDIVEPLFREAKNCGGIGIAFLDEFDKKLIPSHTSAGDNVNMAVQSQILTLIEGRIATKDGEDIDTGRSLFIGLGSFDLCRKKKAEVIHHVGFGQENEGGEKHYTKITRSDMIEIGASYELIGRFSTVINYHELSDETVDMIVMNMAEKIGDGYGCKVVLADEMKQVLRKNANSKFGCRMLESLIRESALEAYTKILKSGKSMKECTILVENDIDSKVFYPGENFPEEKESEPDASELGLAAEGGQKKGRRKGKRSGNEAIPNVAKAQ